MKKDVEIAQEAKMLPITEVAKVLDIPSDELEQYGKYKAKLSYSYIKENMNREDGKLVLVTAINPTPAGEGKTTTNVGLSMALSRLGKKTVTTLREPSLGPCFGVKGGAAGGGYSQVVPMDDINLHFTGDFHAITSAHSLLAALLDNHIHQGNKLGIVTKRIVWKRVVDMNDRALRNIVIGLGGKGDGVTRENGFDITVASEIMAILCLATDLDDLKERLSKMVVAYNYEGEAVTAGDLEATGAMALLLKDAIKPNLVQTLDNTPAFIHGGPFANIAHGCNSVVATKTALKLGDYVITEAGFGADLGAEKFFDIKCRYAGLKPDCVVIVATVRALKMNGGVAKDNLAEEVIRICEEGKADFKPLYDLDLSIEEKMEKIAKEIYRADGVDFTPAAKKQIKELTKLGYDKLPICVAKTQYSFSDDATLLGAPTGFTITVRELRVSAGAGFIVALTGSIMTMPGLPKVPAANGMDILSDGTIIGLS